MLGFEGNGVEVNEELQVPAFKGYGLNELRKATNGFSTDYIVSESGEKAPNVVYKGKLDSNRLVAVKRFSKQSWPDAQQKRRQDFLMRHKRLLNLIGCCAEGDERLLVAEYMPNDTLSKHLFHCLFIGAAYSSCFTHSLTFSSQALFSFPTITTKASSKSNLESKFNTFLYPTNKIFNTHLAKPIKTMAQTSFPCSGLAVKCGKVEEVETQEERCVRKPPPMFDYHGIDQDLIQEMVYDSLVWSSLHGLVVGDKSAKRSGRVPSVGLVHAPFALLPVPFPKSHWTQACELAPIFSELVDRDGDPYLSSSGLMKNSRDGKSHSTNLAYTPPEFLQTERNLMSKKLALQDVKNAYGAEANASSASNVDKLHQEISKIHRGGTREEDVAGKATSQNE
ncbi:serine/threonine-protein kinase bsk2 [Quercus suber]|uniref:Serine/threonine-protein kinase bsk2 n=1 Tax=Quercus suber TaxID=58331 RepID=A0AAW0M7U1_QUESU